MFEVIPILIGGHNPLIGNVHDIGLRNLGCGARREIIAEHDRLEGATLVILHALQEAFGYIDARSLRVR